MDLHCFAIFDSATQAYGRPIFVTARGAAVRSFIDEVNSPREGNNLNKHPDDFELHHVGFFNEQTGELRGVIPELICRGKDAKNASQ